MNFATLKGLTIPEGNVTKITDASGRVLWSAVKPATVTLTCSDGSSLACTYATATINGIYYTGVASYNGSVIIPYGGSVPLTVEVGTTIELNVSGSGGAGSRPSIYLNGVKVSGDTYNYTVTGLVTIDFQTYYNKEIGPSNRQSWGRIYITET
jgi:hypothetical protein